MYPGQMAAPVCDARAMRPGLMMCGGPWGPSTMCPLIRYFSTPAIISWRAFFPPREVEPRTGTQPMRATTSETTSPSRLWLIMMQGFIPKIRGTKNPLKNRWCQQAKTIVPPFAIWSCTLSMPSGMTVIVFACRLQTW